MVAENKQAHPSWFEPKLPTAEECSVRLLLDQAARERPDEIFARFEHDEQWTYAETLDIVRRTAAGLQKLGVRPGDVVLHWLPNGADLIRTWFATLYLGAIHAPVHTAFRGEILQHVIRKSGARLMIAHHELAPLLNEIETADLEAVIPIGGTVEITGRASVLGSEVLIGDPDTLELGPVPQPWDIASIIFTSGTTGNSKGVLIPYGQMWTVGFGFFGFMTREDRMMVVTPLSHIGPISGIYGALTTGASVIVIANFRSQTFWEHCRDFGATCVPGLNPAIQKFILSTLPEGEEDKILLRHSYVSTVDANTRLLSEKIGLNYYPAFAMTEVPLVLAADPNSTLMGTCGRTRDGLSVRLVDEHDVEVLQGEVGELIVRSDTPWTMNAGYHNDPEATAQAWRNGWFHTGDLFRCDAEGNFFFVGRNKDVIRRRGENIAATPIELEAQKIHGVQDAAAIGVPVGDGDEEVLLVLTTLPGVTLSLKTVAETLIKAMPLFMVPRYFLVLPEVPKTASNKVRKALLRETVEIADCWDRTQEMSIKGSRLSPLRRVSESSAGQGV